MTIESGIIKITDWNLYHPWPSYRSLYTLIKKRKSNGLNKATKRIYGHWCIDQKEFFKWVNLRTLQKDCSWLHCDMFDDLAISMEKTRKEINRQINFEESNIGRLERFLNRARCDKSRQEWTKVLTRARQKLGRLNEKLKLHMFDQKQLEQWFKECEMSSVYREFFPSGENN